MKNGRVCEMEYIMKPITVWIADVVGERITNENPIPLQITLATRPLINANCKFAWKLLLHTKRRIQVDQLACLRLDKSSARLRQISTNHIGERKARAMQSFEVVPCKGREL